LDSGERNVTFPWVAAKELENFLIMLQMLRNASAAQLHMGDPVENVYQPHILEFGVLKGNGYTSLHPQLLLRGYQSRKVPAAR
jgi:hypothetical protein